MEVTLFVIALLVGGQHYEGAQQNFPTKAACETVRLKAIVQAQTQSKYMFLVSNCGLPDDRTQFNVFMGEPAEPPKATPKNSI